MGIRQKVEERLLSNYENYYRLAYSYVKNESDAMDIVQESAYKAMKNYPLIKKEEYISTWIYRIVVNTSLDFLRRYHKEVIGITEEEISYEDSYKDFDILEALNKLEEEDRIIVILRYFEDQKLDAIAEITGNNLSTVKTKLYRALKRLKVTMEIMEPNEIRKV
jgi:RNA polymerase sigma-70 factor, ECF subfamily